MSLLLEGRRKGYSIHNDTTVCSSHYECIKCIYKY
uniref:Zinc finger protein n=1 Tax=Caudovirales sp. ctSH72 TaxID=2826773 RepID=A0A8S5QPJ9_9CAUD|nr:MAG TPA: zinc finger protein [Caudovirales sp. ctSH72]